MTVASFRPTVCRRRAGLVLVALGLLVAGCGGRPASPPASPTTPPGSSPTPAGTATPSLTAAPSPTGRPPSATASPTSNTQPPAPTVEAFWAAARRGLDEAGRLRITVIGPSPGVLRYEPEASATVADGRVVFVCVGGRAWDGPGGSFVAVPGTWECGAAALVDGFRNSGQPVDAWSHDLPTDQSIVEQVSLESDGRWRWEYRASSLVFGGTVTTTLWLAPADGRILDARRSDPTGETRYGISYSEAFPPIVAP